MRPPARKTCRPAGEQGAARNPAASSRPVPRSLPTERVVRAVERKVQFKKLAIQSGRLPQEFVATVGRTCYHGIGRSPSARNRPRGSVRSDVIRERMAAACGRICPAGKSIQSSTG